MKRVKVKLIGEGKHHDSFRVNLPTYIMDVKRDKDGNPIIINEEEGLAGDSCDYEKKECYVLIPDDETIEIQGKIKINQQKIRKKYPKDWSKFKASDVELQHD